MIRIGVKRVEGKIYLKRVEGDDFEVIFSISFLE